MKVGILEILALPSRGWTDFLYNIMLTKQYASVTPQAISVWCRQMGHETTYATFYGAGDPLRMMPKDLDVIFISCYTQASPLAYAIAKLYSKASTRTVIGGPHAKAFPVDCQRFFDLVVQECDKELIKDILSGQFDPGNVISSMKSFDDLPLVEERMPEIKKASFIRGKRRYAFSFVPMLASMGCPYTCDFCIDWNNPYRLLSMERLVTDLQYLADHLPGVLVGFHDPNFAIKFDQVFDALETIEPGKRIPYVMECSLSILRDDRIKRLKETNCFAVLPGVESWTDYSEKAGVGKGGTGAEKVDHVADHFRRMNEQGLYLQANFIFGLDTDIGDEPINLTKRFMDQTPFVWPVINIPVPFGGTPLYDQYLKNNRILKPLPFGFYYAPFLATTLKNYDPVTYYENWIELIKFANSKRMLKRRLHSTPKLKIKTVHLGRTLSFWKAIKYYQRILDRFKTDKSFLDFHEGRTETLPEYYHYLYKELLGPLAELITPEERIPNLAQMTPKQLSSQTDQSRPGRTSRARESLVGSAGFWSGAAPG